MVTQALHVSTHALNAPAPENHDAQQCRSMVKSLDVVDVLKASEEISKQYERMLDQVRSKHESQRTVQGAFYTPPALVDHLVRQTLSRTPSQPMPLICDPACGTGNFLLTAGYALGKSQRAWQSLYGTDIDLSAVLICRWRIWIASECDPEVWKRVCRNICVGDSLGGPPPALTGPALREWQKRAPTPPPNGHTWAKTKELQHKGNWRGFDIILGNPPFLSQLSTSTTHDATRQAWLKYRFGDLVGAYTDAAALFLALAVEHLAPGGKLGLVLPSSVLATRDCAAVRHFVAEQTRISSVWVNPARAFHGVNVLTCALVAQRSAQSRTPHRIQTYVNQSAAKDDVFRLSAATLREMPTWSIFTRGLSGLPAIVVNRDHTLAEIAHATADFRDQYYGLKGHISAAPSEDLAWNNAHHAPVITSGLIDLGRLLWEARSTRILKQEWLRPVANLRTLGQDAGMNRWITERRVPKVLLPTQTRVLEPWVDESGLTLPCVPVITLVPKRADSSDDLWLIAAILASPVISALARIEVAGAALSAEAIKLSAKQCLDLPLPPRKTWGELAAAFKKLSAADATAQDLHNFAEVSVRAYDLPGRTVRTSRATAGNTLADKTRATVGDTVEGKVLAWWLERARKARFGKGASESSAKRKGI